jgi:SAM-dependent methyltransferase
MRLKESQLMPFDPACPFCLSIKRAVVNELQKDPVINLLLCRDCHAVSVSRMPTAETISSFYNSYYHEKSYYGQEKKVTFDLTRKFARHLVGIASQYIDGQQLSILDFGGGDGSMAVELAKEFLKRGRSKIDITVVDYNELLSPVDDDRICLKHAMDIEALPKETYTLVIASAVLEHLPQPGKILSNLLDLVKIRGLLYARTPYMLPLMKAASAVGLQWDFHYPSHLHDLGASFWNGVFSHINLHHKFEIIISQPSIVETSFKNHFVRTLSAYTLKLPWYLIGNHYKMVGGWEVFALKKD